MNIKYNAATLSFEDLIMVIYRAAQIIRFHKSLSNQREGKCCSNHDLLPYIYILWNLSSTRPALYIGMICTFCEQELLPEIGMVY
jgi:hypothetical protein